MNRTVNPIRIELGRSRLLAGGLVAAYGAAVTVVFTSGLPLAVSGIVVTILVTLGWRDVARYSRSGTKQRVRRLVLSTEHDWIIMNGAGAATQGRPVGVILAHPWAVSFNLADKDGKSNPVLILPDMTSRQSYHGLRLWLRQNPHAGTEGQHT